MLRRLPEVCPQSDGFDPDRVLDAESGPLSAPKGARKCMRDTFGFMEPQVVLATPLPKVALAPGARAQHEGLITLRPSGLFMPVRTRGPAEAA
ncbi:MAG: hypothetical protein AB1730_06895 [Myxococcota bacterium]